MGGRVFAKHDPPIPTPRMPPAVFNAVLSYTLNCLKQHYKHVQSPIEAPGKSDFGDVDVLVCSPTNPEDNLFDPPESLMAALSGFAVVSATKVNTVHVALEWPEDLKHLEPDDGPNYIQVDVTFFSDYKEMSWDVFHEAHGDLWSILGSIIRPYSLTVNNHGLNIRIPEIEKLDKKKSMILLTHEPNEILEFLGYGQGLIARYWNGFKDNEELFAFAVSCRFFGTRLEDEAKTSDQNPEKENGVEEGKRESNHRDRRRLATRPLYREWIEEVLPKAIESGTHRSAFTRDSVREVAFEQFGVREKYMTRIQEWILNQPKPKKKRDGVVAPQVVGGSQG